MPFNTTAMENATGIMPVVQAVNDSSGGLLGIGILVLVTYIMLVVAIRQDTRMALLAAMMVTSLVGALLRLALLISDKVLGITLALVVASMILSIWAD